MLRKRLLLGASLVVAILGAALGWYLISPLFITRMVNEAFPVAQPTMVRQATATTMDAAPAARPAPVDAGDVAGSEGQGMPGTTDAAAPAIDSDMPAASDKALPAAVRPAEAEPADGAAIAADAAVAEPNLLLQGEFHDVAHEGSGTASIYQLPDGTRVLRLENFDVLNGPDLYVWLSGALDAGDEQAILDGGYVSLGRLKGNQGNQNYELPADLDLSKYHSVTIWCKRFTVNFATAPLQ